AETLHPPQPEARPPPRAGIARLAPRRLHRGADGSARADVDHGGGGFHVSGGESHEIRTLNDVIRLGGVGDPFIDLLRCGMVVLALQRREHHQWRGTEGEPPSPEDLTKVGDRTILQNRTRQLVVLLLGLPLFVFSVLALAQAGSGSSCQWKFPKWFACVLATHENLAGALIGAGVVLVGAWTAWRAVQEQISSDHERALADREEAERLLAEDLTEYADGMAVAWILLEALEKDADQVRPQAAFDATAFMAERLSRPEAIATHRAMVETLGWDRRRSYMRLLRG